MPTTELPLLPPTSPPIKPSARRGRRVHDMYLPAVARPTPAGGLPDDRAELRDRCESGRSAGLKIIGEPAIFVSWTTRTSSPSRGSDRARANCGSVRGRVAGEAEPALRV